MSHRTVRLAADVGALVPLAFIAYDIFADRLSANPIEDLTRRLGRDALLMLTLSLAVSPLVWMLDRSERGTAIAPAILPLRRTFGLYAFLYAGLHFFVFTVLDYGLRPDLLVDAMLEKRYAVVGLTAFLILAALAGTSTAGWRRRLGRGWKLLHDMVYPAAVLVVLHFLWAAKVVTPSRILWAAVIGGLLLIRVPMWLGSRRRQHASVAEACRPSAS